MYRLSWFTGELSFDGSLLFLSLPDTLHRPYADFQERLRYYSLRKQLKRQAAAEAADAAACTFRPDTGNAVMVLALSASRAGNLLETEQASW